MPFFTCHGWRVVRSDGAVLFPFRTKAEAERLIEFGRTGLGFQGYWMGIDPLDGGDSRRSLVQLENGMFALAGRDTALTLCDGTDRGFISFADGAVVEKNVLQSGRLTIACSNTGAQVVLRVRYDLADNGVMIENTTTLNGTPVSRIVFHKVSHD